MRSRFFLLTVVLFVVPGIANAATMTWDCNTDYVLPGGSGSTAWTSGNIFNPDTSPSFVALDSAEWLNSSPFTYATAHKWESGYSQPDEIYNTGSSDFWIDGGTTLVKSKTLTRHAGNGYNNAGSALATLRWTAPAAGNYQLDANMFGVNSGVTPVDNVGCMIIKNMNFGTKIAEQTVHDYYLNSGATTLSYLGVLSLSTGDTLEFVCDGRGVPSQDSYPENVAFQVTINSIPEPGTVVLVTTGLLGLLAYAWRKRR